MWSRFWIHFYWWGKDIAEYVFMEGDWSLRPATGHWNQRLVTETGNWSLRPETGHWDRRLVTENGDWSLRPATGHWDRRLVTETGYWSLQCFFFPVFLHRIPVFFNFLIFSGVWWPEKITFLFHNIQLHRDSIVWISKLKTLTFNSFRVVGI